MAYTTIDLPTDYFNTKLYSGNGSTQNITGLDFQPDWVWIKERTSTSDHMLFDSVRGATNRLESNTSDSEASSATQLNAFNSDGWTTGSSAGTNESGQTYASWNWLAGGSASSNSNGSITSSVSANTTAGFSIVSYTGNATNGATVGHGLGAVPDMLIGKDLSDGSGWGIWHKNLSGATYRLAFTTDAQSNDSFLFGGSGNTLPTSTVFTLGSGGGLNGSNANIVYAFTSIKGYSKYGSYIGGGSNPPFVYLGFKPAFFMVKPSSGTTGGWTMYDNAREPVNDGSFGVLTANSNNQELTELSSAIDFTSNGVKIRGGAGSSDNNASGATYIYMAFAESPFVTSSGVPTVAR